MSRALLSLVLALTVACTAVAQSNQPANRAVATFAGECFWCTEVDLPGVISTMSGYTGGHVANPSYTQVSAGGTGHAEAVEVVYDPNKVSYEQLLSYYWRDVDPTVQNRQFCDVGGQYRTAIFVHDNEQRRLAEDSRKKVETELKQPIYKQIVPAGPFYKAEDYHQEFYQKNAVKYKSHRWSCGRDQRLEQLWGAYKGNS
jgi:peptide-methionine (S)-S-oxide reductase